MGQVKKEGGENGVFFIFSAHHPLCDVAATAGFSSRVPAAPPHKTDIRQKGCRSKYQLIQLNGLVSGKVNKGEKIQATLREGFTQIGHATDLLTVQYQESQYDTARHGDDKLDGIGKNHAEK